MSIEEFQQFDPAVTDQRALSQGITRYDFPLTHEHIPFMAPPFENLRRIRGAPDIETLIRMQSGEFNVEIIGPSGVGKTRTTTRILNAHPDATLITFEDAQWAAKRIFDADGNTLIDPKHISGTYTVKDYEIATQVFKKSHDLAHQTHQMVVAETVATTGVVIPGIGKVGRDRGTSAIADLARGGNTAIIALSAPFQQFEAAFLERSRPQDEDTIVRPGGTPLGTLKINQDIAETILTLFPDLRYVMRSPTQRARALEYQFYPWLMQQWGLSFPFQYIICENVRPNNFVPNLAQQQAEAMIMQQRSFLRNLPPEALQQLAA